MSNELKNIQVVIDRLEAWSEHHRQEMKRCADDERYQKAKNQFENYQELVQLLSPIEDMLKKHDQLVGMINRSLQQIQKDIHLSLEKSKIN